LSLSFAIQEKKRKPKEDHKKFIIVFCNLRKKNLDIGFSWLQDELHGSLSPFVFFTFVHKGTMCHAQDSM
jgi:hypothetical protein